MLRRLAGRMRRRRRRRGGARIALPAEEGAEAEMLHDWELAQDFDVVHLQHALVDLAPSGSHAGDVVQHWRVFPEGALLDVVDESDGAEVHVFGSFALHGGEFGYVAWVWGVRAGAFGGGLVVWGDGGAVLGGAEDVGEEGVVV